MTLLLAFTVALCTSLALTPIARAVALRFGIVDRPDGQRKLHDGPVALWGGVAVYCGLCAGLAAATLVRVQGELIPARLSLLLVISGGLLGLIGLIDDTYNLRARTKLLLQIAAVSPVVIAGYFPERVSFLGGEVALTWIGPLVMVFWLVACVNALNLLDGLDGFSSVVGIALAVTIAAVGIVSGNSAVAVSAMALAGGVLGFLPFNLPPATIYLGDAGSMMIGLALGALSMQATDVRGDSCVAVVPLAIMSVPLWDTAMAIVRRRLRGQSVGEGDREHLHHRLLARGMSNLQALFFVTLLCLSAGGAVMLAVGAQWELLALVGVVSIVAVLAATRTFGEEELGLLRRAAAAWTVSSVAPLTLPMQYQGVKLKRLLRGRDWDQTWDVLTRVVEHLECESAVLAVSADLPRPPRKYRRDRSAAAGRAANGAWQSTITVSAGRPRGPQCDLRVAFAPSCGRTAIYAACLADTLSVFAEHFLQLAQAAEADSPALQIVVDEVVQSEAAARRAA